MVQLRWRTVIFVDGEKQRGRTSPAELQASSVVGDSGGCCDHNAAGQAQARGSMGANIGGAPLDKAWPVDL